LHLPYMIILEWILPLQLQKTKRTITDSEQLKKEVAYHTYQTDILLQQNEKLIQEAGEHVRSLHLAKEVRAYIDQLMSLKQCLGRDTSFCLGSALRHVVHLFI
jgi:hypothetical protein